MTDLFENEQKILDDAIIRINQLQNGAVCANDEFISLVKEYRSLLKQIRRVVKISDRTTVDLHSTNTELLDKSHYDMVTGIYNRRFLDESLKRIVRSLSRSGEPLSVLMLEVDCFNDYILTYGSNKGDECIKAIASELCDSLFRADDFAARCEDGQFGIVLPNTDANGAGVIANRIIENIKARHIPYENSSAGDYVTVSLGIVTDVAKRKKSGCDYLKRAQEALSLSKQNGGNKYTAVKF